MPTNEPSPTAPTENIKWAPTRNGVACNVCRKPVHYDKKLGLHVHDDLTAPNCGGKRG